MKWWFAVITWGLGWWACGWGHSGSGCGPIVSLVIITVCCAAYTTVPGIKSASVKQETAGAGR